MQGKSGTAPPKFLKVRFGSGHNAFLHAVLNEEALIGTCEEYEIDEIENVDFDHLKSLLKPGHVIIKGLRYFEQADTSVGGAMIPSLKHIVQKMNEFSSEVPDFAEGAQKCAQKYYKYLLKNPMTVDALVLDPRLDDAVHISEVDRKKSYARLGFTIGPIANRDYLSELMSTNCEVSSNPLKRAMQGTKSIEDFLTNPKFERRRKILLYMPSACTIERANVQFRLSYNFNQSLMSDEILGCKLILRTCQDRLVMLAIDKVLSEDFDIERASKLAKTTKIADKAAEILAKIQK